MDLYDLYKTPFKDFADLGSLAGLILQSAIIIAGVIFLFLIVGAGFKIITSAGNNDPKSAGQGKQALTYAIIGFFIIFATYWIIRIIEEVVGARFFTNPKIRI